jgi:hypothetical protein
VGPERGVDTDGCVDVDVGVREVMPQKLRRRSDRTHVRAQNPAKRRKCPKREIFSLPRMGADVAGICVPTELNTHNAFLNHQKDFFC